MSVSAPYRFVSLSKLIFLPDWADQVSHDQPFADGLCGELTLEIKTHTPLCVGGEQDKASEQAAGEVKFYRTPDNQLAIPGTSLKGMLRNVLEIASFARFRQVEDQKLGVRDISDAKNFYCKEIVQEPVKAGWLTFSNGHWYIQPCSFSRIHQADLIKFCRISEADWKQKSKAKERYSLIGICPEVQFTSRPMPKRTGQWLAKPSPQGDLKGSIVVTGQPGPVFDANRSAKKYEFVFHDTVDAPLNISPTVMAGFRQIHEASEEWKFWVSKLNEGKLKTGIPVFFHLDGKSVKSLGLAMMYKLPYRHSLHEAIKHTHDEHLGRRFADLSDLLFGHLGDEKEQSGLRGRVSLGMALINSISVTAWEGPCILNSPKPTFYPAYIRQDGKSNSFRQLMEGKSELAGWKRYPIKPFAMQYPQDKAAENKKTQVRLETVSEGTCFISKLRFHNLRRVELGALLWAIDFGNRPQLRHGLGMGKPFGLGQVSLTITGQRLRANSPTKNCTGQEAEYLLACREEFADLMNQVLKRAGIQTPWDKTDPLKALLEHATPTKSASSLEYLPKPKAFTDLRHEKHLTEIQQVFHEHNGLAPEKSFNTTTLQGYLSSFDQRLEKAADQLQASQQKAELEKLKAEATDEDRLLLDIEALVKVCQSSGASKSQKDNLAKSLNRGQETSMDMDDSQKLELRTLAEQAQQIDHSKIQHACKKVLRDVVVA